MEKLVLSYTWGDGVELWDNNVPFKFSSKDDFIVYIWENIPVDSQYLEIFNYYVPVDILQTIERHVFTLEEWFDENERRLNKY